MGDKPGVVLGKGGKAAMLHGYHGKVLRVDLSSRSYELQELPERALKDFIGGVGLATRLLYEHTPAGCEPLSPANPLIFATTPRADPPVTTPSVGPPPACGCHRPGGRKPRALRHGEQRRPTCWQDRQRRGHGSEAAEGHRRGREKAPRCGQAGRAG